MSVKFSNTSLDGVMLIEPVIFEDQRGFFLETYHSRKYADGGIDKIFVQDNCSRSIQGVIRGMHYQLQHPQDKLIYVVSGEIYDVVVDIRRGSPTFGEWEGFCLSDKNRRQVYIPQGFAHGFCVQSGMADVVYKCSDFYDHEDEFGILWSDPAIGIDWPVKTPVITRKDSLNLKLDDISDVNLPSYL